MGQSTVPDAGGLQTRLDQAEKEYQDAQRDLDRAREDPVAAHVTYGPLNEDPIGTLKQRVARAKAAVDDARAKLGEAQRQTAAPPQTQPQIPAQPTPPASVPVPFPVPPDGTVVVEHQQMDPVPAPRPPTPTEQPPPSSGPPPSAPAQPVDPLLEWLKSHPHTDDALTPEQQAALDRARQLPPGDIAGPWGRQAQPKSDQKPEVSTAAKITTVVLDFVPMLGTAKNLNVVVDGVDPITGEEVGIGGRIWAAFMCVPIAGPVARYLVKGLGRAGKFLVDVVPGLPRVVGWFRSGGQWLLPGLGRVWEELLAPIGRFLDRWLLTPLGDFFGWLFGPLIRRWRAFRRSPRWFHQPTISTGPLERGLGATSNEGDIVIDLRKIKKLTKAEDFPEKIAHTTAHERGHQMLTPMFQPGRTIRVFLMAKGYKHSHLLRGLEEALVDARAQLMVRGLKGLPDTFTLVTSGYKLRLARIVAETAVAKAAIEGTAAIGQVVIDDVTYSITPIGEEPPPRRSSKHTDRPHPLMDRIGMGQRAGTAGGPARAAWVATATLAITAAAAAGTYAVATAGGFTTPRPAPVAAGQPSSSPSPAPAGQAGTSSSPAASPSASASTAPPIAPTPISLPAAVARQLGVVTTPVKTTTDVSATGVAPEIATVFTAHGFELHDEQFGFRPGFDPSAESSWPAGVPGAFQWTFDFFPSGADASAVQEVAAAHLVAAGFTPMTVPGLSDVGVTVRTRTTGDATTQVWSYVNRNVLIQMAVNGRGLDGASALARQLFTALGGP